MSDVTNYDGRLEAMASYSKALYINLAKLNEAYYNEVTTLYSGTLPAKYADVVDISMIGGRTLAMNQLVDAGTTSVDTISGHKYFTYISGTASVITSDGSAVSVVDDAEDMVIDLTLMFGPGDEPADATAFEAIFPSLYEYDPGSLISAGVTSVVSKDSDDATIGTYAIPETVQSLPGYGLSAGSVYNYIDLARKVFVKQVETVNLGTLSWTKDASHYRIYTSDINSKIKSPSAGSSVANITSDTWETKSSTAVYTNHEVGIACSVTGAVSIGAGSNSETVITDLIASLDGKYITYELATPIETDISAYITAPNIKTEAGGSIVLENSNGDDYRIPVPATIELVGVS